MTIIAVDVRAGLMVADTQVGESDGTTDYHTTKIFRASDGSLVGAGGDNPTCMGFLAWARAGCKGRLKLDLEDVEFVGLRLTPERELHVWMNSLLPDVALNTVLAVGSGKTAFDAARLAGAPIDGAVRIACALVPTCGLPITSLRLEDGE